MSPSGRLKFEGGSRAFSPERNSAEQASGAANGNGRAGQSSRGAAGRHRHQRALSNGGDASEQEPTRVSSAERIEKTMHIYKKQKYGLPEPILKPGKFVKP